MAKNKERRLALDNTADNERPRVLLAEDDTEMRRLLAERLEHHGYDVIEVQHGFELVRLIDDHLRRGRGLPFDGVVTDVRMPGISGLHGLELIHELDSTIPVVVMTAFPEDACAAAARFGAVSLLQKPFPIRRLIDVLHAALPT